MDIKRTFIGILAISMMSCSTIFAVFYPTDIDLNSGDTGLYPKYLYDNVSYPRISGRMDHAIYLDASSVVVKYLSADEGIVWAQYEIGVGFTYDGTTEHLKNVSEPQIYWYYFPKNSNNRSYSSVMIDERSCTLPPFEEDTAYYSSDYGQNWHPISLDYQTESEHHLYRSFWIGLYALENSQQISWDDVH